MPFSGDTIKLKVKLPDGTGNKYPLAYLYDFSDAQVGSPIALTHVANGYYTATAIMPNTVELNVVYIIFDDSSHTIRSASYGDSTDSYDLSQTVSTVTVDGAIEMVLVPDNQLIMSVKVDEELF